MARLILHLAISIIRDEEQHVSALNDVCSENMEGSHGTTCVAFNEAGGGALYHVLFITVSC